MSPPSALAENCTWVTAIHPGGMVERVDGAPPAGEVAFNLVGTVGIALGEVGR